MEPGDESSGGCRLVLSEDLVKRRWQNRRESTGLKSAPMPGPKQLHSSVPYSLCWVLGRDESAQRREGRAFIFVGSSTEESRLLCAPRGVVRNPCIRSIGIAWEGKVSESSKELLCSVMFRDTTSFCPGNASSEDACLSRNLAWRSGQTRGQQRDFSMTHRPDPGQDASCETCMACLEMFWMSEGYHPGGPSASLHGLPETASSLQTFETSRTTRSWPLGPPRHYLELCNVAKPDAKAELSLVQVGPWRSWAPDFLRSAGCSQATTSTRYCFQSARCLKTNFYGQSPSIFPWAWVEIVCFGTSFCEPGTGCHEGGCRMPDNCTASHAK